jgi:hypothetical protein
MFPVKEIDPVTAELGANDTRDLMPPYRDIPEDFKNGHTRWNRLFNDWFYVGLANLKLVPKDGVDTKKAITHIRAVMGSFEPKHEHKEAGVAYLLDQWFEDVSYDKKNP